MMIARSIAYVGIRLLSVFTLLQVISHLASMGMVIAQSTPGSMSPQRWMPGMGVSAVLLVVAAVLWCESGRFSTWICPLESVDAPASDPIDGGVIGRVVFSAVGLFTVVLALPKLAQVFAQMYMARSFAREHGMTSLSNSSLDLAWVGPLGELVLGLLILLGSQGIAATLFRIRDAGIDKRQAQ